ncbi:hypothetical protein [Roseivirga sp. UBA1976]|uniref:hypothetical protein n=1 Tax=Roseivirga sp. UBA1976 TaxID=1947386 RepID=UPI00257CA406|nr:hypothetical protein [Roseivirga sp. UBA1976]MEC7754996.1 hypothetical protein [Bacteroidota bacterium]|tara:strand:- start:53 stop:478 length:426 start_codon:yes stop_codon:yes gene_type:complete
MKGKLFSFKFWIVVLFLFGCSNDSEQKQLSDFLSNFGKDISNYQQIIIVNVDVCNSCDNIVRDFLYLNQDNDKLLIILSSNSQKKIDIIIDQYDNPNILKDGKQDAMIKYGLIVNKPVSFTLQDSKFTKQTLILSDLGKVF